MENDKNLRIVEDEQEEEAKMEKFFALIKSFREARNYRRKELMNDLEKKKNNNKKMKRVDGEQSSWVPKFEWEDFTKEVEFIKPPLIFPAPCNEEKDKKDQREDESGLDLKLTL
jgi:hypothetical protein